MSVSQKIKDYISNKGISQSFLAKKIGMSPKVMSKVLNNQRSLYASEFLDICEVLDLDPRIFRDAQK